MDGLGAQHLLVGRYRTALRAWADSLEIRRAAETLGVTRRMYADLFVARNFGPLQWSSTGTADTLDQEAAYRDAESLLVAQGVRF